MTYKSQLLAIAARLQDGDLSTQEQVDMGKLVSRHAAGIGRIERAWDEVVEEARCSEIAHWDMASEPCARFVQ